MAKPTQDPKWVTTDDPANIIEPSAGTKLNGITSGGIWAREHLNWMFNSLSKWVDWVRDNVRSNTENDARYVQHTEVVDTLTSTSTTNPLSANQGKVVNDKVDATISVANAALTKGTTDELGRTNAQNDARFLLESNNLSDLTDNVTALGNIGMVYGTATIASNSTVSINVTSGTVVGATVSIYNLGDNGCSHGCTWSGGNLNIRNSRGATTAYAYIALVSLP